MDTPFKPPNPYNDLPQEEKDLNAAMLKYEKADIKKLISAHPHLVDMGNSCGRTPLMYAAMRNDVGMILWLEARGAKVNKADDDGNTALMYAATQGRAEAATALLDKGAKIETSDVRGRTALIDAATYGQDSVVKLLLKRGALAEVRDNFNKAAMDYAKQYRKTGVIALLENEIEKREKQRLAEEARAHKEWLKRTDYARGVEKPVKAPRKIRPRPPKP